MKIDRRAFLLGSTGALLQSSTAYGAPPEGGPGFASRGVVLVPEDITLTEWPDLAHRAGLTTIALHHGVSPQAVVRATRSDQGKRFLDRCHELGLQVEYELHAMKELLPRSLFEKDPTLFRMNDQSSRVPDVNLCVHSHQALDIVAENARSLANQLRPTTGRYFFWGDDGAPWCGCPACKELTDSDQALILENHLLKSLRSLDPEAQVAHLAYSNTLAPPEHIKPAPGVFLEYAPINRRYDIPYAQQADPALADSLSQLDANLKVFGSASAQVLEYWLDVSRFSKWRRPSVKLPWNKDVFLADLETYRSRGIHHVTSFGAWIDADYNKRFDDLSFIREYGDGFNQRSRGDHSRTQVDDWKTAMRRVHSRFKGTPGTLAQFGDSITETRAFWSPLFYERKNAPAPFEQAFQKAKEHLLPDSWTGGKGPENGNQGGQTTKWALDHIDEWLKRTNPEVALILFGTNDLSSIERSEYERQLTLLVSKCLNNGTIVILATIPPRHAMAKKSGEFAFAARNVARELSVPLVDLQAEILRRRPEDWDGALEKFEQYNDYDVPTLISRDGVHPSYPQKYQSDYSEDGLRSSGYTLRNYLSLMKYTEVLNAIMTRP